MQGAALFGSNMVSTDPFFQILLPSPAVNLAPASAQVVAAQLQPRAPELLTAQTPSALPECQICFP